MARDVVHRVAPAVALAVLAACGRIAFEPTGDASGAGDAMDAMIDASEACVGDLLVDSAEDDPAQTLACQGAGCSLRAALTLANARGFTTICLGEDLTVAIDGALEVTSKVAIIGTRSAIRGQGTDRVFSVLTGGTLLLRSLTVSHGRLTDAPGAGVLVAPGATLDADEVRFDDHVVLADALQVEGAAIRAEGDAVIDIRRSRFTNNRIEQVAPTGFARGAALAIAEADAPARVNLEDTAFEDNFATNVGGALFLRMGAAGITMQRLLFARNTADTGSAIDLNCSSSGTFVIENSTFADNGAPIPLAGSLVYVCAAQTLRLAFCSFAGNATPLVRLDTAAARVELRGNAIAAGSFELCTGLGAGTMLGGNVTDRDSAMCPLSVADQRQAPLLGTLSANEGLTATLPLLSGSPAIDAVMGACPAVDQRGKPRPVGAACDAGAFEVQ